MKSKYFIFKTLLLVSLIIFLFTSCPEADNDPLRKRLTLFSSLQLESTLEGDITWSTNASAIVSVTSDGIVTAHSFINQQSGTGEAIITATNGEKNEVFTIISTMAGVVNMMELDPLKERFSEYFDFGNIFNPVDVRSGAVSNPRLTRHYNVLSAENDMKPDKLNPGRGNYNFGTANSMVNAAVNSGFKVVGHTLLWHSQIPSWQVSLRTDNTSRETTLQYMKEYITNVVTNFKGKIYQWDVLNEAFPDGGYNTSSNWRNVMRAGNQGNPWYIKIGADFVYEGFKAARLADPDAVLYYNDYNLNMINKATMVHNMVRDVNLQWLTDPKYDGKKLIQGIGMQGHHNTGISASSILASLNLFRDLGVEISISELDVLSQTWGEYSGGASPTTAGKLSAAQRYGEYFKVFLENSDIITRVTFWGVFDEQSWRSRGQPLLFEGSSTSRAKPAYYKMIEALEQHEAK